MGGVKVTGGSGRVGRKMCSCQGSVKHVQVVSGS